MFFLNLLPNIVVRNVLLEVPLFDRRETHGWAIKSPRLSASACKQRKACTAKNKVFGMSKRHPIRRKALHPFYVLITEGVS